MKTKSFVAIGSALLLIAGMFTLGAGAANATESNQVGYWQALYPNAVSCYKYDNDGGVHGIVTNGGDAVTLNPFQQSWPGDRWEVLIVNGGSVDTGNGPGNAVYPLPTAGTPYFAPQNAGDQQAGVSHWIVCKGETPVQNDATASAPTTTDPTCDAASTVVLGKAVDATWGKITYTGADSRDFSVTATATGNHKFADGTSTKTFTGTLMAAKTCTSAYEVAIYIYPLIDSSKPASWQNSGKQALIAHRPASSVSDWYTTLPTGLPDYVCGPGWGVQQDIAKLSTKFAAGDFPQVVERATNTGVLGWPPLVAAIHQSLSKLVTTIPDCTTTVKSVPEVTFTDQCGTANDTVNVPEQTGVVYTTTDSRVKGVGNVTVTATPAKGYTFSGQVTTTSWSHDFTDEPCLVAVDVVPEVTFSDLCSTTNDGFTVPEQTGVVYATNDSRVKGVGNLTVTATPAEGYTFSGQVTKTSWSHDFTNAPCPTVKPIAPSAFDPVCATDEGGQGLTGSSSMGYIELDLKEHLHYTIDGEPTNSAQNFLEPGTYTVAVTVDDGFTLEGPASWEMVVNPPFCPPTFALLSTTASMSNITCSAQGSYTLANTEGVEWFVNGSSTPTAAGTYKVTGASTVNVEAKLINDVVDGWEEGAQKAWTFKFTDPTDCLPTLAFTGSNGNTLGLLLAGGLLLFGGGAIAFERTFRFNAK